MDCSDLLMADIAEIRSSIPFLGKKIDNKQIIYFDSACMALRPQSVIDQIVYYYSNLSSCGGHGRSSHPLSREVTETIDRTRSKISNWINSSDTDEVIFTKNTTEGMNLVIQGHSYPENSNIVTTAIDHHSSSLPAYKTAKTVKQEFKVVQPGPNGSYSLDMFIDTLDKHTEILALTIASNVSGEIAPIREIVKVAHENDTLVVADAAQLAPHERIDIQQMGIDFLSFSVHKLGGPTGMGVLWGKYELLEELDPLIVGGETVENVKYSNNKLIPSFLPTPTKFEAGLGNYAGIFGTEGIIDFYSTYEKIMWNQEKLLNNRLVQIFKERTELQVIGNLDASRLPLVSFFIPEIAAQDIALFMSSELPNHQIMMRAGVHCAAPLHYALNLNASKGEGSARISLAYYNTEEELDVFEEELDKLMSIL
ncbi:MAG: aminotransferase class V-fold PLP-dependent enzyme [Candidatus Kariarchaeaceae archaeon]